MSNASAQEINQTSQAKVFISYSRRDIAFADQLDAALKMRGFEPLIDRTDIYAFQESWEAVILIDFSEMRAAGVTHPLMDEIEKQFSAGG
jgi:hypothetical protein